MRRQSRNDRTWPYCRTNTRMWWSDKKRAYHRKDGPAMEKDDGHKFWYDNGKITMTDVDDGRHILPDGVPVAIESLMLKVYELTERVIRLERDRA